MCVFCASFSTVDRFRLPTGVGFGNYCCVPTWQGGREQVEMNALSVYHETDNPSRPGPQTPHVSLCSLQGSSILADSGTTTVEMIALSLRLGDNKYAAKVGGVGLVNPRKYI